MKRDTAGSVQLPGAQPKTANVLFAVEANRRWAGDGITVNALMPGGIATGLQRHVDPNGSRRSGGRPGRRTS